MQRVVAQNPDLDEKVARWRTGHPAGTLEQAVRDLGISRRNPADKDAQRMIWIILRNAGDPAAVRLGFQAMRTQSLPAATAAGQ
jgi:hypothetical protein